MSDLDPLVRERAQACLDRFPNSRAAKAIRLLLEQGSATTRDLNRLGYDHPPRAIGDVKDIGLPIIMEMIRGPDGKRMARYRFGSAANLRAGQTGRSNFSKAFKERLLERYGPVDCITNVVHPSRLLQIDHRVPFRVLGDGEFQIDDVDAFMLLDAKSQRAKSWSCEQCRNFIELREADVCRRCFWAFPEDYDHIAMNPQRRCDIVWEGNEVVEYERLADAARLRRISLAELLKSLGREQISNGD